MYVLLVNRRTDVMIKIIIQTRAFIIYLQLETETLGAENV